MSLGAARTRLRVSTTSLRTRANSYSTKGSGSGAGSLSNLKRYMIGAGVVGTPGLWWLVNTRDDVPHLGSPPAEHWSVEPGPSKDQVTRIISQGAYSFLVRNVSGVSRYDGAQVASNSPCEDQFIHGKFPSPWKGGKKWMAWAVLDGHSGAQTAELLKEQLLPFVRYSLSRIKPSSTENTVPEELVQHAIIKGFTNLDDSIVKTALATSQSEKSLQEKVRKLAPAYSGSCALLSMYDSTTGRLHVACTGDSRAVLGQQRPDGRWEAMPLSVDQTGYNKEEIARLQKEHPDEEDMVKNGRVLGLAVSRAFGDCQWKWPVEFQKDVQRRFYGPPPLVPRYPIRTPPYLTAEPVVTSIKIDPGIPSFLIMATDGLWDMLSSQQAVDLVGKWLETKGEKWNSKEPTYEPFDFGHFWKGVSWKFVEERTTVQDDNVAVHLVRNSLGGNHHELIAGRLAFSSPSSRRLRDDTTVQVVFFNYADLER
ncbi:protein serine/threonine phosphatase 2C [Penicillium bovifimosum]|uniref:Protein serine/threonine phosphatase 2C n=1 Tax=Penicillium bovifimosum TaxID=126998 RepID=A0A9W9L3D8_9EURO|nr:protein serine/threonine phosphatase 2C [Penicillium bovifimosum]KAJ5135061.1 protein serine/threonine phosphatase 2C [Penicillium bovifimosum]